MSGEEKGIKERINRIAGKPKNLFVVAGGVVIFVAALVIITFSSAEKALEKQEEALEKQEAELRAQVEAQVEQAQEAALQAKLEAQMEQIQRMEEQIENEAANSMVQGETIMHNGVDPAAEEGADVVAAEAGKVYQTGYNSEDGNYVILYHEVNGAYTYYTACKEILVTEGEQVKRGQKIAKVGQTGRSTGPHLHFAVQENGEYIEPVFSEQD